MIRKSLSVQCFPVSLAQEPFLSGAFHKPPAHLGKQLLKLIGRIPPAKAKLNRKLCFRRGGELGLESRQRKPTSKGSPAPPKPESGSGGDESTGPHGGDFSCGPTMVHQTSLWPGLAATPLRTTQLAHSFDLPGTMRPAKRAQDLLLSWQTLYPHK